MILLALVLGAEPPRLVGQEPLARQLQAAVSADSKRISGCWEGGPRTDHVLTGALDLRLTLSAQGQVTAVEVKLDTLSDPAVSTCVQARIQDTKFPLLGEAVRWDAGFVFAPESGQQG